MISPDTAKAHREAVSSAIARLKADGYTVIRGPRPDQLPNRLERHSPDYVAQRGDQLVIGEVRDSATAPYDGDDLGDLAAISEAMPGWRLELIWLGEDTDALSAFSTIQLIAERVLTVVKVDLDAALLLAWSGLEAALNRLVKKVGAEESRNMPTRSRITNLYSLGWLSDDQYGFLESTAVTRNEIAHGLKVGVAKANDVERLARQSVWIGDPSYKSVDQMVDWFFENYEDPANGVPYDTREGGYQYVAGGPFDALEVLSLEHESAPDEVLNEAVDRITQDGADWVSKGDY